MNIRELIAQGWQSLMRNKLRSTLTMLGIIWGLVCVVTLLAYGNSLGSTIYGAITNMSSGAIIFRGGQTSMQAGGQRSGRKINLEYEDVDAVRREIPLLKYVSAESIGDFGMKYGTRVVSIQTRGIEANYDKMRQLKVGDGRMFNDADFAEHRRVIIFGADAARKVFQGAPGVGQSVNIGGLQFDVIGVLKKKIQDSMYSGPDNDQGFMPFDTYRDLKQIRDPDIMVVQPVSLDQNKKAIEAVRAVMGRRHHFDAKDDKALTNWDTIEGQEMVKIFTLALTWVLGVIGALTLGVGGLGVMNIMLVSVMERTREIGLRKALGARPRDIMRQFLLEALVLTFAAGAIGMVLSYVVAWAIPPMPLYSSFYKTANHEGDILLHPSGAVMLASFVILALVGIVSGLWPAIKAARMHPIEALRYE
jgi:putative ABC transport system permease protein